jgi:predicted nucleotidyltransferase
VFGSFARGQQHQRSDLDLLVDLPAGCSLLDLARLKVELEARLRRKVDVIPEGSLKPALRDRILAEARPV